MNAELATLLKKTGLKVTSGRLAIIKILSAHRQPITVAKIVRRLRGQTNQVTVYRTLETLAVANIVRRIDFQHGHAHYELNADVPHHHHLVCESCGQIEDVKNCQTNKLERSALRLSKKFKAIRSHALEFFGLCQKCAH